MNKKSWKYRICIGLLFMLSMAFNVATISNAKGTITENYITQRADGLYTDGDYVFKYIENKKAIRILSI